MPLCHIYILPHYQCSHISIIFCQHSSLPNQCLFWSWSDRFSFFGFLLFSPFSVLDFYAFFVLNTVFNTLILTIFIIFSNIAHLEPLLPFRFLFLSPANIQATPTSHFDSGHLLLLPRFGLRTIILLANSFLPICFACVAHIILETFTVAIFDHKVDTVLPYIFLYIFVSLHWSEYLPSIIPVQKCLKMTYQPTTSMLDNQILKWSHT